MLAQQRSHAEFLLAQQRSHAERLALDLPGSCDNTMTRTRFYQASGHEDRLDRLRKMSLAAESRAEEISRRAEESLARSASLPALRRRPRSAAPVPTMAGSGPAGATAKKFIPSKRFEGMKKGYTFKIGDLGVGYYLDRYRPKSAAAPTAALPAPAYEPPPPPPPQVKLDPEAEFQRKQKLTGIMSMVEEGLNSRFSDMYKAFQYVDLDRSGRLSRKEPTRALEMWNVPIGEEQLDMILGECDRDGDGGVSYEEFVDKLARGTVASAAMGKRGMQSKEAMGVDSQEMLAHQLGHTKLKKFVPTING